MKRVRQRDVRPDGRFTASHDDRHPIAGIFASQDLFHLVVTDDRMVINFRQDVTRFEARFLGR